MHSSRRKHRQGPSLACRRGISSESDSFLARVVRLAGASRSVTAGHGYDNKPVVAL